MDGEQPHPGIFTTRIGWVDAREITMTAHGIMFHHFHGQGHPKGQGAISADDLARLLDHVGLADILPAEEWLHRAEEGTLGDSDVCLTFDDSLLCQYDIAYPVLKQLGLTAFWFVYSSVFEGNAEPLEIHRYFRTTSFSSIDEFYEQFHLAVNARFPEILTRAMEGFVPESYLPMFPIYTRNDRIFRYLRDDVLGKEGFNALMQAMMDEKNVDTREIAKRLWMTDDQLRRLAQEGHVIGLHSHTHPTRMASLPAAEQEHEYRNNHSHVQRVVGVSPVAMSHPCNSYGPETLEILRGLGVRLGFRATMAEGPPPSPLEFPRKDHSNIMRELSA